MKSLIEKIDSYQIITNLLPGAFLILLLKYLSIFDYNNLNKVEIIAICYFGGLIVGRIGSLVIEPILKKVCFIKYSEYNDFVKASKEDSKLDILVQTSNFNRSILTCVAITPLIKVAQAIEERWKVIQPGSKWVSIFLLIVLFLFAYRKQIKFIKDRVETVNSNQ